jgi:hypothetical protein
MSCLTPAFNLNWFLFTFGLPTKSTALSALTSTGPPIANTPLPFSTSALVTFPSPVKSGNFS